jgi:hypothetical protein
VKIPLLYEGVMGIVMKIKRCGLLLSLGWFVVVLKGAVTIRMSE